MVADRLLVLAQHLCLAENSQVQQCREREVRSDGWRPPFQLPPAWFKRYAPKPGKAAPTLCTPHTGQVFIEAVSNYFRFRQCELVGTVAAPVNPTTESCLLPRPPSFAIRWSMPSPR
jgi:hypothetical protein